MIPAPAGKEIAEAVAKGRVRLERVDELERSLKHDVMAIVRALAEASGEGGAWVHFGSTSADITDTALALELKASAGVLRDDLTALARALQALARTHRATPEVGRTHGQHGVSRSPSDTRWRSAPPRSCGNGTVSTSSLPRLAVGKMAGAVGTGAGFGPRATEVEEGVMAPARARGGRGAHPDRRPEPDRRNSPTGSPWWRAPRNGSPPRSATFNGPRSPRSQEPFDEARQVGSSTMAQKRNPMLSENVTSLARLVRAFALPPLENMVQWHERDLANSANERVVLPHSILLTDDLLTKLTEVFAGLRVDSRRMAEEVDRSAGGAMTENLMLALTARGSAPDRGARAAPPPDPEPHRGSASCGPREGGRRGPEAVQRGGDRPALGPGALRAGGGRKDGPHPGPTRARPPSMSAPVAEWTATISVRAPTEQVAGWLERALAPEADPGGTPR